MHPGHAAETKIFTAVVCRLRPETSECAGAVEHEEEKHGGDERHPDDDQEPLEQEDAPQLGESLDQVGLVGDVGRRDVLERLGGLERPGAIAT